MRAGTRSRETAPPVPAGALERRYRWLLLAYPRGYRAEFGEELIATLLETAEPERRAPPPAEAAALVRGGLRTRIGAAAREGAWADGLHLGVTVLSVLNLAALLPYAGTVPVWAGLSALTLLAVLRGWTLPALPLTVLVASKVHAVAMGHPWLDRTLLPVLADPVWDVPPLYSGGGPVAPVTGYALAFLGLAVLAVRGRPPIRRSWCWWLAVPLLAGTGRDWSDLTGPSPSRVALEVALLLLAGWAGRVAADPRWALGAVAYLAMELAVLAESAATATSRDLAHWALLALLTGIAVAVPYRVRRQPIL